ncbi:MAG: lytic transglycosylase domain-containing protein [Paracoccaceae bacterium]
MRRVLPTISMICALLAAPALAEEPKPYPDFTFKRVGVPRATGAKRITVQIDPNATKRIVAPKSEDPVKASLKPSGYEWYWALVSPDLDDTGPGRLSAAVQKLNDAPIGSAVKMPRLQHLQDIAETHGRDILASTIGTKVSPALVLAVIGVESAGKIDAVSSAGAQGLMQLMPDTAARFGVTDSNDAKQNIKGGVAYLDWLLGEFDGDPVLALAGYNAGEGAVKSHSGVPPYPETRAYVPKVMAAWTVARGLCLTPPELVSDGCVFAIKGVPSNG